MTSSPRAKIVVTADQPGRSRPTWSIRPEIAVASGECRLIGLLVMGRERSVRCRSQTALGIVLIALTGCSGAPAVNILGSYFPSWMLCALAGIAATVLVRYGLVAAGIDKVLPAPLLVYSAFTVFFAFAVWLAWLG
jgi:hypothetical protein